MAISAIDTISLAFEHTRRQLLQPFRFWQWTRLAIVGLLAGELSSSGGFNNISRRLNGASTAGGHGSLREIFSKIDPAILASLITTLIVTGLIFVLVMTYISSVMRFILFDSILQKECHIRDGWNRRQEDGWRYFLWQVGLLIVTFGAAVILIGIPAAFAFAKGWFNPPRAHLGQLILTGIIVFFFFMAFVVVMALVHVLTKDFVIPQMALEGIGAVEGWRRLWPRLESDLKDYVVYVLMKIVLAIGAGIVVAIVTVIMAVILAIPIVGVVVTTVVAAKAAGLTWNVVTITAAVVAGCVLFLIFFYFVSLISVPVIVFFPAYSIYFFAPRYQQLNAVLYPPPPPSTVAAPQGSPPPFTPPPLPAV